MELFWIQQELWLIGFSYFNTDNVSNVSACRNPRVILNSHREWDWKIILGITWHLFTQEMTNSWGYIPIQRWVRALLMWFLSVWSKNVGVLSFLYYRLQYILDYPIIAYPNLDYPNAKSFDVLVVSKPIFD